MNRWLAIVLMCCYAIILLAGYLVMQEGPPPKSHDSWKAARNLPMNHQLREGDLEEPKSWSERAALPVLGDLLGKHLLTAKKQGDFVEPKSMFNKMQFWPDGES
jgi:hypothetical protein